MSLIPIRLSPIEVQINAPRNLVFRTLTDFGSTNARSEASSRVLSREGSRLLVEFKTRIPVLFGRRKVYRTVEWVTLHEPERVDFEEMEGPLAMRRERLILVEEESTHFRYEAELGVRGWVLGWFLGGLFIRPKLKRAVREHLEEIHKTTET